MSRKSCTPFQDCAENKLLTLTNTGGRGGGVASFQIFGVTRAVQDSIK